MTNPSQTTGAIASTSPPSDSSAQVSEPSEPPSVAETTPGPKQSDVSTSTVTTPATAPVPQTNSNAGGGDVLVTAIFSSAVLAALLTAALNLALARRKSLEEERARLRSTFAEAFEAVVRYKEMPYAIRRRRADEPSAERVRLSEEMRAIQAKLSYYEMWTAGESATVGGAYATQRHLDELLKFHRLFGRTLRKHA